ncbi:NAD-dependent epimerase/dehydratase family protein [Streptomyces rubiginosohelvolus]|uniref:NAD-dependent epimerase/dehydratase family protein n=1 Tax=Streptomyces rubiginosohelvolus TaxID=67362 RepID=UPI0035E2253A
MANLKDRKRPTTNPSQAHLTGQPEWLNSLEQSGCKTVAVVGGSGRLGSLLTRFLAQAGIFVHVLDATPGEVLPGTTFTQIRLGAYGPTKVPDDLLDGVDAVVHLAALHGAHLVAGYPRNEFWRVNVGGTDEILAAAQRANVPRVVVASSTSIYGAGTAEGMRAKVLHEDAPLAPEDVYDLTKLASEELLRQYTSSIKGSVGVALRFGRFFFPSHADYHLRKLSTGLDAHDACQAVVRALTTPLAAGTHAFCIASDHPMSHEQREHMGIDLREVLTAVLPELLTAAERRGTALPQRIGKSVDTSTAREQLGFAPERSLAWVASTWNAERRATARMSGQRWSDLAE